MLAATMNRPSPPSPPTARRQWRWLALAVTIAVLLAGLALWWFVLRHDTPAA